MANVTRCCELRPTPLLKGGHRQTSEDPVSLIAKNSLPKKRVNTFTKAAIQASYYDENFGSPKTIALSKQSKASSNFFKGAIIGNILAFLSSSTGLNTTLHEYVGHGLLGLELTNNFPEGKEPVFQVDGWQNFQAIFNADSLKEVIKAIWRFLTAFDFNGDGAAGFTSYTTAHKNELGAYMGKEGSRAWVAIAGSIPTLMVNSLSVASGMAIKDKKPVLGWSIASFGVLQHLLTSSYSWSAALMSQETLLDKASSGHDFATFAVNLSKISGLSSKSIAIGTSLAWTSIVPALAIGLYLRQQSQQLNIIPDHVAIQNILLKSKTDNDAAKKVVKSINSYPRKEELISLCQSELSKSDPSFVNFSRDLRLELRRYTEHLIETLPKKTIEASKKEVLTHYAKLQKINRAEQVLSTLSTVGTITVLSSKILKILGETIAPYLGSTARVLNYSSPLLTSVSVLSGGHETYKDLMSQTRQVPNRAKVISVAKLVVTIVSAIGLVVGTVFSGFYTLAIAALLLNIIGGIALSFARQKIIKQRFELLHSLDQGNWDTMYSLLEIYKKNKSTLDINITDSSYQGLHQWLNHQKSAYKKHFLNTEQIRKLTEIGLFSKKVPIN